MASPAWILTGNAGTNPATDFLGTTDNQPLIIKTLGTERIRVDASGRVGIGIVDPAALLSLANYNSIRQLVWDGASNNTQDVNCGFGINLAGAGSTLDIFMSFLYGLNIVAPTGPWPYPGFVALLTVLPNGNIGIGMTLPAFALHMPAGKTLRIEGGTNAADAADYFSFGGNGSFGIDAPGIPNGRFVVLNSGSTGIGIPNPDISTRLAVSFQAADAVSPSATGVNAQLTNDGLGPSTSAGVVGQVTNLLRTGANTQTAGVRGINDEGHGVQGQSDSHVGCEGTSNSGTAMFGQSGTGVGVWATTTSGPFAGLFQGPVLVTGALSKPGGGFRVDHPVDPANKYLNHSFVESSEMKNIYDGVARMDSKGEAIVALPTWMDKLNEEFRVQLTPLGAPAPQIHVAEEVRNGKFRIAGGSSGQQVFWQVTGVRKDPWAKAHPLVIEEDKKNAERDFYLHPELYGKSNDRNILAAQFPKMAAKT
jgi:hypothetical protein